MEPDIRPGGNPDPLNLHVKPELLVVLRHAGLDLLAYDGAPCSEVAGPLREAARRIEADPDLCQVGGESAISSGVAEGIQWAAERCADRLPGVTFWIRTWEGRGSVIDR